MDKSFCNLNLSNCIINGKKYKLVPFDESNKHHNFSNFYEFTIDKNGWMYKIANQGVHLKPKINMVAELVTEEMINNEVQHIVTQLHKKHWNMKLISEIVRGYIDLIDNMPDELMSLPLKMKILENAFNLHPETVIAMYEDITDIRNNKHRYI